MVLTAFLGFFGGEDGRSGDDLADVASVLDTAPTPAAVEREVGALQESIDAAYGTVESRLDERQRVAPDATPREKAAAIQRAVSTPRSRDASGDDDAAARAAAAVRDRERPTAALSRRLLDQVSGAQSTSASQLEDTLAAVVERLDEYEQAQDALDRLESRTGVESVPDLVEEYRTADRGRQRDASERERLEDAVEALLGELDVDDEGSLERRVRRATREVGTDARQRETSAGDASGVEDAVSRARASANPRSRRARHLFDALADGDGMADALAATAERLDEAATTDAVLEDVDAEAVVERAETVATAFADADAAVADSLGERARELADRVERADDSNRVVAFAAREELAFYERSLVDEVSGSTGGGASTDVDLDARVERVRERRAAVESDYVDRRSDHNHSIPLYFLSLVDSSLEDAVEHADAGRAARAAGALSVTESLLDHVEGLYEQNQYSVMLRSLRG